MPCLPGKLRSWDDRIERIVAGKTPCQIKPVSASGSEFLVEKGKKVSCGVMPICNCNTFFGIRFHSNSQSLERLGYTEGWFCSATRNPSDVF